MSPTTTTDLRSKAALQRATERNRFIPSQKNSWGGRRRLRVVGLFILCATFGLSLTASLAIGARSIDFVTAVQAVLNFNPDIVEHLVVQDLRMPRTLIGIAVGAALGISGVLMQAITRNPLADPGLLGVNAGASFAVVMAIWLLGITAISGLIWFAFIGAGFVSILVYLLGSMGRGGATPVRLALAGAALSALLLSLISAILITNQQTLDVYRFWVVGSITGGQSGALWQLLPFIIVGILLAIWAAASLNAMALGDETARALGTKLTFTRVLTLLAVTLLCGSSVAMAGPVGFLGLVVPHMARAWCGPDQRWLIAYALFLGPIIILISDIVGRIILPPSEVQVGIMTALLGGPLFVWIVRNIRMAQI